MTAVSLIVSLLRADPVRWHLLGVVSALKLPDCWIGAGFIRNAVWDHLHGQECSTPAGDVDVIWFDPRRMSSCEDRRLEATLSAAEPGVVWSVKNQARMHTRNGDDPYLSAIDAMRFWPETATAVAVRRSGNNECDIAAPLGLEDLISLVVRPTKRFSQEKRQEYENRLLSKGWLSTWPLLKTRG